MDLLLRSNAQGRYNVGRRERQPNRAKPVNRGVIPQWQQPYSGNNPTVATTLQRERPHRGNDRDWCVHRYELCSDYH
jgi:hypothetical protein